MNFTFCLNILGFCRQQIVLPSHFKPHKGYEFLICPLNNPCLLNSYTWKLVIFMFFPKVSLLVIISLSLPSQLNQYQFTLIPGFLPCYYALGSLKIRKTGNLKIQKKQYLVYSERGVQRHVSYVWICKDTYAIVLFSWISHHQLSQLHRDFFWGLNHMTLLQLQWCINWHFCLKILNWSLLLWLNSQLTTPQTFGNILS